MMILHHFPISFTLHTHQTDAHTHTLSLSGGICHFVTSDVNVPAVEKHKSLDQGIGTWQSRCIGFCESRLFLCLHNLKNSL